MLCVRWSASLLFPTCPVIFSADRISSDEAWCELTIAEISILLSASGDFFPRPSLMSTSTLTATGFTAAQLAYQIKHQDEDRSKVIVITTTLMIVLSVISVVLRLYSRRLAKLRLRVDDYSIIVALVNDTRTKKVSSAVSAKFFFRFVPSDSMQQQC